MSDAHPAARTDDFPEVLLLLAQSARMLAQSAARAGIKPFAIDLFADRDTREYARCFQIPSSLQGEGGFDESAVLDLAERLSPPNGKAALVYGSGVDNRPALVDKLSRGCILLGNSPASLRLVNNPRRFFSLLEALAIPYPDTRFSPPARADGWLIKPCCGGGGKGVRFLAKNRTIEGKEYFQRQVDGDALSVLFLAGGKEARIVGFNTLWTARHDPQQPFLFAGAVNRADLSDRQQARLAEYAAKLTDACGLVGLNSLDFVVDGDACLALEVNPRPSATMALYDADYPDGLLFEHIAACRGRLPASRLLPPASPRAFRIVYAPYRLKVPASFQWPRWCADLPNAGLEIGPGEPLCSVQAEAADPCAAENLSRIRQAEILACCDDWQRIAKNICRKHVE